MKSFNKTNNINDLQGSFLQVKVNATFMELLSLFGDHLGGDEDGKINHEWIFVNDEGEAVNVYDWKIRFNPNDMIAWHIGSAQYDTAVNFLRELLQDLATLRASAVN